MIDSLIEKGHALESQIYHGQYGKSISGVDFEAWASKVMLYLERNFSNSEVTLKAADSYKTLGQNSVSKYQSLLGAIIAAKDIEQYEEQQGLDYEDLNN